MTYSEKLKDPRWQKKRLEIMQRDNFSCRNCGDKKSTLNVHHIKYPKNAGPWSGDDDDKITLCENCHMVAELCKQLLAGLVKTMGISPASALIYRLTTAASFTKSSGEIPSVDVILIRAFKQHLITSVANEFCAVPQSETPSITALIDEFTIFGEPLIEEPENVR